VPAIDTWHGRAPWHSQMMLHCWPAGCASFVWHGGATRHRAPMLNAWRFHETLSDLFHGLKLAFLALLSAEYHPSFRSFNKIPKITEKCYMSEIYAKGG